MGIEFSKPAVIKVTMDAIIAENYDLQKLYEKAKAMEDPTRPAITEQQALSKIAERFPVGTDQLVKMLESTEALSKQDKFCAPHFKSSLPTQPELVEVPKVTGVMIDYFKREGFSLHESLNLHVNVPNTLSLVYKEFREWLTLDDYATKEDIFARAWLDGWTEEKEQLYYVKLLPLGYLIKHKLGNNHAFINSYAIEDERLQAKFTEKEIKAIDERYWAFAVPVEEED